MEYEGIVYRPPQRGPEPHHLGLYVSASEFLCRSEPLLLPHLLQNPGNFQPFRCTIFLASSLPDFVLHPVPSVNPLDPLLIDSQVLSPR